MILAGHHTMLGGSAAMRCAVFDGLKTSRMQSAAHSVSPVQHPQISIVAWILCRDYALSNLRSISLFDGASNKATGPELAVTNGTTGTCGWIFQWVTDFQNVVVGDMLGEWHHYAISFVPTTASIYFDGHLLKTASANYWLRNNEAANLVVGLGSKYTADSTFVGKIANVSIFDRAVSGSEIATLAADPTVIPTGAMHQWLFANDDGVDTGIAQTKWDLTIGSTTAFEKLSTGGG